MKRFLSRATFIILISLFLATLFCAPWAITEGVNLSQRTFTLQGPIFAPPTDSSTRSIRLMWEVMLVEWAALGILGAVFWKVTKTAGG